MSPYMRMVKTASGARAVQIVHSSHWGSRDIEHIGSAHDDAELELLKAVARQRVQAGLGGFDLGSDQVGSAARPGAALPITSTRMRHLTDAFTCAFTALGLDVASGGDEVFAALVLARIIEPTSKLDSLRVLEEAGAIEFSGRAETGVTPEPGAPFHSGSTKSEHEFPMWPSLARRPGRVGCTTSPSPLLPVIG